MMKNIYILTMLAVMLLLFNCKKESSITDVQSKTGDIIYIGKPEVVLPEIKNEFDRWVDTFNVYNDLLEKKLDTITMIKEDSTAYQVLIEEQKNLIVYSFDFFGEETELTFYQVEYFDTVSGGTLDNDYTRGVTEVNTTYGQSFTVNTMNSIHDSISSLLDSITTIIALLAGVQSDTANLNSPIRSKFAKDALKYDMYFKYKIEDDILTITVNKSPDTLFLEASSGWNRKYELTLDVNTSLNTATYKLFGTEIPVQSHKITVTGDDVSDLDGKKLQIFNNGKLEEEYTIKVE